MNKKEKALLEDLAKRVSLLESSLVKKLLEPEPAPMQPNWQPANPYNGIQVCTFCGLEYIGSHNCNGGAGPQYYTTSTGTVQTTAGGTSGRLMEIVKCIKCKSLYNRQVGQILTCNCGNVIQ